MRPNVITHLCGHCEAGGQCILEIKHTPKPAEAICSLLYIGNLNHFGYVLEFLVFFASFAFFAIFVFQIFPIVSSYVLIIAQLF